MIEPFLKWPGGKRWLSSRAGVFPADYSRYFEPFLGGGAVFFRLAPPRAILADTNAELINAYRFVRQCPDDLERELSALQKRHSRELYYRMRALRPRSPFRRALRFIYLNRACFNGMYRVNRQGMFNVPMGSKQTIAYPPGYLSEVAKRLRRASIQAADFEATIEKAEPLDLLYVDPPYTVAHNSNNFIKYNAKLFSWEDQQRLAAALGRAAARGVKVLLSNADHSSVRALYEGFGYHYRVGRASSLAAAPEFRQQTTELLVANFELGPDARSMPGLGIPLTSRWFTRID